jgi:bifunctional non-homologous end joining protein LigD
MPLIRIPGPFDHPDWLFEMKLDGFRALAHVKGHLCRLVSRRGHEFKKFTLLAEEIAHSVRAHDAILGGEIACLGPDGRCRFYDLLFRREWPFFCAFDVLSIDGEDLTDRSFLTRKRRLRGIMPTIESRLPYIDHVRRRGVELFDRICREDCEGIVAKWARGRYHSDGVQTSWLKIKNPDYSQMIGRPDSFTRRTGNPTHRRRSAMLCREPAPVSAALSR